MALNYISVPDNDFSRGIDARSSENQIEQGFVKDLLNANTVKRRVRKRKGYQGYAGNLPVRVFELEYDTTTNEICFSLDESIALDTVRSSPLIVYGRSSLFTTGDGPFTDTGSVSKYYPTFSVPTKKILAAPSGTLTIPGEEHGYGTTDMFASIVESTSTVNRSWSGPYTDSLRINKSSYAISVDYSTYIDRQVYSFYKKRQAVGGDVYIATLSHGGAGSQTFLITAGTHGLSNTNIIPSLQYDNGTEVIQVQPDTLSIAANGDVSIVLNTFTATTYYLLLSASPLTNRKTGVIAGNSTSTITITDLESPWIFSGIYLELTPGGIRELVIPDSVMYDGSTNELSLSFTNSQPGPLSFLAYYDIGEIRSNKLCVTDATITVDGLDTKPQLSVWGLEYTELYTSKQNREAWVNHIDSYRNSGEQRLISGLGGNLFSAREYDEASSTYLYPTLFPDLNARSNTGIILAPLFWETSEVPQRTRGYITGTDSGTHWATVTSVQYDSGTGWTKYGISIPNKQILDSTGTPTSLSSVISTTVNFEDILTVQDMSYSRHNGSFKIRQTSDAVDLIYVWVENENNSSDWDDLYTAGEGGVFTDILNFSITSPFIAGDQLQSEAITNSAVLIVQSELAQQVVVNGINDRIEIPGGVVFTGIRTSSIIPMRSSISTSSSTVENLVRGDMISYSGIERLLRVKYINASADISLNITITSTGVATAILGSGDTSSLSVGQNVLLREAGPYTGTHIISGIPSLDSLTFETDETTSNSAILVGNTIEVDELLNWQDSTADIYAFRVEERWIPIEAPQSSYNQPPSTHIRYFDSLDYSDQPFLRSTMVVNNMYFTDSSDESYKYDGVNNYRAGLLEWQPGLFLTQETSGANIVIGNRTVSYSAIEVATGRLTIDAEDQQVIPVGTQIRISGSTQTYTVSNYTQDDPIIPTTFYMLVDRSLDSTVTATGTAAELITYRYYYRLNAVDRNSNLISSAVTGYQDHVVEMTEDASINHKIVGMPIWDAYDYDRLEVEIYRTKKNTSAPFYKVTTLPMSFDESLGYIEYSDTFADTDLTELDVVNTALKGAELGTNWSQPLRAKSITSIGNRLVLGNVRDYPQLDIQIVGDASLDNSDFVNGTLLFRRDNTDTSTTTDMINRVKYEWLDTPTGDASNFIIGTDMFSFDTSVDTGATEGDWIYLSYASTALTGRDLSYSGWYQISTVSTATVTVNLIGAAAASSYPNKYTIATSPTDVPVLLGPDGNLGMVNGDSFDTFDTMRRMSMAINTTMRIVDTSLTSMSEYTPWLVSRGGNDLTPAGRLLVRQPRTDLTTMEVVPTFSNYSLFINEIRRSSGDQISASTRLYPSRVLVSYENYPEIFDNPNSILDTDSESAIDINSADGQEITGIIPFFGEAAFGAAQQSSILVVFKTNSIYLVDINQKVQGLNPVQRIETEGLGCTAPNSIAVTKGGITFANESGIYCLRRNQAIQYLGEYMERNWTEKVDLNYLELVQGHHYGVGRQYKLSVPISSTQSTNGYLENSQVYVYDHTEEDQGKMGAWDRYDNHPATGWANLNSDAFFGSTLGRVFSIRRTGSTDDYRDDGSYINFLIDLRPNDFGNGGIRKVVDAIVVHYRTGAQNTNTEVLYSVDLEQEYATTTPIDLRKDPQNTGIDDRINRDIDSILHNVNRRRCIYFGLRITNAGIDEDIEIAGVELRVGGLTERGITQSAQTR